jgi:hypothetical protein
MAPNKRRFENCAIGFPPQIILWVMRRLDSDKKGGNRRVPMGIFGYQIQKRLKYFVKKGERSTNLTLWRAIGAKSTDQAV